MKKTIIALIASLLIVPVIGLSLAPSSASAASYTCDDGRTVDDFVKCNDPGPDLVTLFKNIIDTALYIVGAVSVLMLIYGGIRYTTSGGNANHVTEAKNTVLYAIVGIVVAICAYAIVGFVVSRLQG